MSSEALTLQRYNCLAVALAHEERSRAAAHKPSLTQWLLASRSRRSVWMPIPRVGYSFSPIESFRLPPCSHREQPRSKIVSIVDKSPDHIASGSRGEEALSLVLQASTASGVTRPTLEYPSSGFDFRSRRGSICIPSVPCLLPPSRSGERSAPEARCRECLRRDVR